MAVDRLSLTFGALADPTRRAILARLARGGAVSKHLKVLERAGLVTRGREAQWRPAALEAGPLKEVDEWVERYRVIWEQRLDRLDGYLKELQQREKKDARKRRG